MVSWGQEVKGHKGPCIVFVFFCYVTRDVCTVIDHALSGGIYFYHAWSNIHLVTITISIHKIIVNESLILTVGVFNLTRSRESFPIPGRVSSRILRFPENCTVDNVLQY